LHTDWSEKHHGWDILRFLEEKQIPLEDLRASYICHKCGNYFVHPYIGEEKDCPACGSKKTVHTKTSVIGVSEEQLNEIYNCMDVYCHPFTSGGQELPIQEAKAAGLITLVTEYSCGTDSCYEHQGGIPLKWNEYREPSTQFIKASTCPNDIADQLEKVFLMKESRKARLVENGQKYIQENFSVSKIVAKLKEIILEAHAGFAPTSSAEEKKPLQPTFEDLLDKEDNGRRIAVVIPQSEQDVFLVNSLIGNLKKTYPNHNLYFITKPEYFELIEDHPDIHKIIPFQEGVDSLFLLEGRGTHKGYFEIAFLPHATTQKFFSYQHNGKDIIQFPL
jgi:DNA-directed RNA polymerase subunit RPC12/RpoP